MSSIQRPLSGDVLVFTLEDEQATVREPSTLEKNGRNARTLLKSGPLRVTLVALAPGGAIAAHQADGPITVQPLQGQIMFRAGSEDHELGPGQLLSAGPGVRHEVSSSDGATFLLTVAAPTA